MARSPLNWFVRLVIAAAIAVASCLWFGVGAMAFVAVLFVIEAVTRRGGIGRPDPPHRRIP